VFFAALSQKRIDLMSMLGVYIVMGVGMVVAFLTLIAEIFWKQKATKDWVNRVKAFNRRFVHSFLRALIIFEVWPAEPARKRDLCAPFTLGSILVSS